MGCEEPPQFVVEGVSYEDNVRVINSKEATVFIRRHPELFLIPSVKSWIREYDYYNGNHSLVPFYERHSCWVEGLNVYEHYLRMFQNAT